MLCCAVFLLFLHLHYNLFLTSFVSPAADVHIPSFSLVDSVAICRALELFLSSAPTSTFLSTSDVRSADSLPMIRDSSTVRTDPRPGFVKRSWSDLSRCPRCSDPVFRSTNSIRLHINTPDLEVNNLS
ncbi:hypothetical protein B0H13DRAFT_2082612 [Mycena leptocephala]|nr:hypothetical protein B0H13DRAFT_2082612 [Mycena leptocephala]